MYNHQFNRNSKLHSDKLNAMRENNEFIALPNFDRKRIFKDY